MTTDPQTVQVGQRGDLTLPAALLRKYSIKPGDTLSLIDLDGVFVLSQNELLVPALAREIEQARLDAGVDTSELLQALRDERARFVREMYGDD